MKTAAAILIAMMLLSACGGGGDDGADVSTPHVDCKAQPEACR